MKIQNDTLWKKSFKILLQENVLVYCISILKVTFLGHPVDCILLYVSHWDMISDHYSLWYQKYIFKSVFPNKVGFSGPLEQLNGSTGAAEVGGGH